MKHIVPAILIALTAMPATAFERMMRSDCQVAFEKLADIMQPDDVNTAVMSRSIRVSPQGWCEMRGGTAGLEDAQFDTLEWRAEGITRWTRDGIPPLALEVRISGMDPDEMQGGIDTKRPNIDFEMLLRQLPDAGMIVIEHATMNNGAGDSLTVSGVFERVFLSSPSMMQVSMGSAAFKAGLVSMTLEGTHENPFGFGIDVEMQGVPQAQRDAAFDLVSRLPDGVLDGASRAELTAYAGDLPKPVGELEVSVGSERGLGLMQVGMWAYNSFEAVISDEVDGNELDILLDGITITADWSPDAQLAD
ncbi:hypothetical protein SAMN05444287_0609 [Octadecabacter temperatus]|uniref:Uncharacterized protein n=1 Tax=Octadecabacter temperatus TaxID=1458307 RepID=A0A0K0Y3G8_9RHOB|nr:hypothetical protein [Octadecabacter temperatus]AKS45513.1 hypothetical protein OSB_09550 [Octadecabacter temperatus]SIN94613.1 hypothetical protein SAMN05444287_0609 [Octadecabacter temperatus]